MKNKIITLIEQAIQTLIKQKIISPVSDVMIHVERTRDTQHGDFASNIAMVLAKQCKINPRDLANQILTQLSQPNWLAKADIAGPGFINFYLHPSAYIELIKEIFAQKEHYGQINYGAGKKCLIEFVSANPTGPLHVGHGRGAAYGAALASLLATAGFNVHREYYVNDAGRQMDILATSLWLRYLELCGETFPFPTNGYRGDYLIDIAKKLHQEVGTSLHQSITQVMLADLPLDEQPDETGDKEAYIDALILRTKQLLGEKNYRIVLQRALDDILQDIREDLAEFGVHYDQWFSEHSLKSQDLVKKAVQQLEQKNYVYEKDGAKWFKSTEFGDDKDRVLVRENGEPTYFANDIAYHLNKFERGYDHLIDIWGADHHGYVTRLKAAPKALGYDADQLTILLVQFAVLYRGGEKVQMSTRSGTFVTLRELRAEVGNDAARFFYVARRCEQHMDFDLDLAKSQSNDNPIFYIQYAHARIASVFRQLAEKELTWNQTTGLEQLAQLTEPEALQMMVQLARYPETIESAARSYEPHQIALYLREVANQFHAYYNQYPFLNEADAIRQARLTLCAAVQQVLRNGLSLLGCSAPEKM